MTPIHLSRVASLPVFAGIARNPLPTLRRLHERHGPFVLLHYPHSRHAHPQMLGCIADAELYRTMYSNPEEWRSVNINWRLFRNHASHRLNLAMTRLRGARHAHYRRLLAPPLSKPSVAAMGPEMAEVAQRHVRGWPQDQPVDAAPLTSNLMQDLAIKLLFGDDQERARQIAHKITYAAAASWPLPGRAALAWFRIAPKLERDIIAWAAQKRGETDPKDILSILVNNPDEEGREASHELIGGILSFTFGAAYETCQNALNWTLVLLTQHPDVAASLADEIDAAVVDGPPLMDKIGTLPLLDGVVKEAMRLFPPVPIQFRRSTRETDLGDVRIPAGTRVLASAFLINRNPQIYRDPTRFHPERWRDLDPSPYDYTVFGAGGRMCPGFMFGNQMVKTALAAIMSRYRVALPPRAEINFRASITLGPYPELPVVFRSKAKRPVVSPMAGTVCELFDPPPVQGGGITSAVSIDG